MRHHLAGMPRPRARIDRALIERRVCDAVPPIAIHAAGVALDSSGLQSREWRHASIVPMELQHAATWRPSAAR
jgi:hypothetical protein